jgi:hypothetical protein
MATSSNSATIALGTPPFDKLTRANFPGWRAQVLPAIRGARLLGYLTGAVAAPPEELAVTSDKDGADQAPKMVPNPAYDNWIAQDQIVLSYLLQSLSHEVLPHVHRIEHAAGVWQALEEMFVSQSEAKITNLRTSLANTKKLNMTTATYLTKMQGFVDELAMAGCPVSTREHVSFVLAGLGGSYNALVAALGVQTSPISLSHLYAQIDAYDNRQEMLRGSSDPDFETSANTAQRQRRRRPNQTRGDRGDRGD